MRLFLALLGVPALLALSSSGAAMRVPAVPDPVCVVARPMARGEPPAWLLLAGAVLLLGAGRLAKP